MKGYGAGVWCRSMQIWCTKMVYDGWRVVDTLTPGVSGRLQYSGNRFVVFHVYGPSQLGARPVSMHDVGHGPPAARQSIPVAST
jgi:hypothetical protein